MKEREEHPFDDLEPLHESPTASEALPDLPEEHELEELPHDLEEVPRGGGMRQQRSPAAGVSGGAGSAAADAPQGKRELDRAPLELRKASVVLLAGSIFPWADPTGLAVGSFVEKLLCFLAVWMLYQSHVLKYGGKASGLVAGLGKQNLKVPMIIAGVIALVGLAPVVSAGSDATGLQMFAALTEKAFLLLAGYTFVHIYDYEHGGKFNPMFPLLFLAPAIGGFASIFTKVLPQLSNDALKGGLALVGAALVALGGLIACHTMYVAMKEAKAHGEAKKAAALEARKAARAARGSRPGGESPRPGAGDRR